MPDDVLEDLFFGKIDPWENRPSNMEEFHLLNQKMSRLSDALDELLDDEAKSLLDQ